MQARQCRRRGVWWRGGRGGGQCPVDGLGDEKRLAAQVGERCDAGGEAFRRQGGLSGFAAGRFFKQPDEGRFDVGLQDGIVGIDGEADSGGQMHSDIWMIVRCDGAEP